MLPRRARMDLGAMAMKGYSVFPKAPALLEPHHQIAYCHIQDTRCGEGLTPLQRNSRCILQPQPTGQWNFEIQLDHLILTRMIIKKIKKEEKRESANHRVKIKKSKKRDKYSELAKEERKLCNMRVTVIPIIIDALGAVPGGLERGLKAL